jgi:hypothetical protein
MRVFIRLTAPDILISKNAVPLSLSGSISVPHDD